jgi:hypothetical protein
VGTTSNIAKSWDIFIILSETEATMDPSFLPYRVAAHYLDARLKAAGIPFPTVGVICGSGLSGLSGALDGKKLTVNYADIPGFPAHCTVAGHKGEGMF